VTMLFSVWAISIEDINNPKVTAKIKTGNLVGQMVDGIRQLGDRALTHWSPLQTGFYKQWQ